jgi:predicted oxidoreductase
LIYEFINVMTGAEPLISAAIASAVSGVTVPIFQSIWGGGGQLLGRFSKNVDEQTKQILFVSQKYEKNYKKRHGILKLLGMRQPVE